MPEKLQGRRGQGLVPNIGSRSHYERQDVLELFRFIDWVLSLPKGLEERFWQELNRFEERRQMQYVTSVERIGIEKGIQKGRKEGEEILLKCQLIHRFGKLPNWVQGRLSKATTQDLERWAERILEASNLEEVFD